MLVSWASEVQYSQQHRSSGYFTILAALGILLDSCARHGGRRGSVFSHRSSLWVKHHCREQIKDSGDVPSGDHANSCLPIPAPID